MKKKLSGKGLVIELDSGEIRVSLTAFGKRPVRHKKQLSAPLPQGAVEDGEILMPEAVAQALRDIIKANRLGSVRKAVFCLCSTQILAETATIPNVERKWLAKMISSNRDVYFPVDTEGYQITFTLVDTVTDEDGKPAFSVRLWAAPREFLRRYYKLANSCGLSVEAMDYCGNSFASAIGATYAAAKPGKKRSGKQVTGEAGGDEGETNLYLLARNDFLLLTFTKNGCVTTQRFLRRDGAFMGELQEVRLAVELLSAGGSGRRGAVHATLMGEMASDEGYAAKLEEALGLDVDLSKETVDNKWFLCGGAALTTLDFGDPTMDKPKRFSFISQFWQFILLIAAIAVLGAAGAGYTATSVIGGDEMERLEKALAEKEEEFNRVSGYSSAYNNYLTAYNGYLNDWRTLLGYHEEVTNGEGDEAETVRVYRPGALRTYNDNLKLVLEELEDVLPQKSTVTQIRIEEGAVALQLASETKEDAVNLFLALRYNLKYTTLYPDFITDLAHAEDGRAPTDVFDGSVSAAIQAALTPQVTTEEAPPTEGGIEEIIPGISGLGDLGGLGDILATLTDEERQFVISMISKAPSGNFTNEEMGKAAQILKKLTPDQRKRVAALLGCGSCSYALPDLLASPAATFAVKQAAMEEMLHNPVALYVFALTVREDYIQGVENDTCIWLDPWIDDIVWAAHDGNINFKDIFSALSSPSMEDAKLVADILPLISDIPTRDEENLDASVQLILTNDELSGYYAYYLAVELGLIPPTTSGGQGTGGQGTGGQGTGGQGTGGQGTGGEGTGGLPGGEGTGGIFPGGDSGSGLTPEELMKWFELWSAMQGAQGGGQGTGGDITGGLGGGGQQEPEPPDPRYFMTVVLLYDEDLAAQELTREGLDPDAYIPQLEVEQK